MYSNCLFCPSKLGENQVIEHMAVGKRLAFDINRGRLWVVCPRCGRWNLCPFDERWETLEDCERLSGDSLVVENTDSVSLLRHPSGISLIRVGEPRLPELLSWRFARSLVRRRRQHLLSWSVLGVAGVTAITGSLLSGGALVTTLTLLMQARGLREIFNPVIDLSTADGRRLRVTEPGAMGAAVRLSSEGQPTIRIWTRGGEFQQVTGADIPHFLTLAMPYINTSGATTDLAVAAAGRISEMGGPEGYLERIATDRALLDAAVIRSAFERKRASGVLSKLPPAIRIGLEAASHVHQEERVLSGDMESLVAEWRNAEELAEISDRLIEPPGWAAFEAEHGDPPSGEDAV